MAITNTENTEVVEGLEASEDEVRQLAGADTQAGSEALEEHEDDPDEEAESTVRRDTELEGAATDEERDQIREKRKLERRNKSKRQRDKIESQQREIESLKSTVKDLSVQFGGIQDATLNQSLQKLDEEIARAAQAAKHFRGVAAEAVTKQNGEVWADASEKADAESQRLAQLKMFKQQVEQGVQRQQTQRPAANPVVAKKATDFAKKHGWYGGPQSKDLDSRVLTQLDADLTNDGWDPTSDGYWNELESRIGKYLPHRTQQQREDDDSGQPAGRKPVARQPVAGANGGNPGSNKGATYQLSAARVQAIKDAGNWNDPAKRTKAIKSYQEYDKRNATR